MTRLEKKEKEKISSEDRSKTQKNEQDEKIASPKSEVTPEEKLKTTQEKLLRTMAEMENQRRRFEKERQEAFDFGGFNLARESLSLLDNIDRAVNSFKNDSTLKNSEDLGKIVEGIDIVKKDLVSIFKKNTIEAINCINKKFDPNFHQAMLEIDDSTQNSGIVVQEIQKGFTIKDRLLRPSLVGVSKKSQNKDEKNQENNENSENK